MFENLGRVLVNYRKAAVALFVIGILVAGAVGSLIFSRLDSGGYSDPNSDSYKVYEYLRDDLKVEDPAVVVVIDAGDRDVHLGHGSAHAPVAFVLHQHQRAGLGDHEVDAGYADLRLAELVAQRDAADRDQFVHILGVAGAGVVLGEYLRHVFLGLVDRRHDDVRGLLAGQLDDVLAHVRFQRGYAGRFGGMVQLDFLADHRLALDHQLRRVFLADAEDDRVGLVRGFGVKVQLGRQTLIQKPDEGQTEGRHHGGHADVRRHRRPAPVERMDGAHQL